MNYRQPDLVKPPAKAILDAYWIDGRDIGDSEVVAELVASVGAERRQCYRPCSRAEEAGQLLRAAVDRWSAKGMFGSPFFVIDGEPFFGLDKMELMEDRCRDRRLVVAPLGWETSMESAGTSRLRGPLPEHPAQCLPATAGKAFPDGRSADEPAVRKALRIVGRIDIARGDVRPLHCEQPHFAGCAFPTDVWILPPDMAKTET